MNIDSDTPKEKNTVFWGRCIVFWMGIVFGYIYVHQVHIPNFSKRLELLDLILKGEAKADYIFAEPSHTRARLYFAPNIFQIILFLMKLGIRKIEKKYYGKN